MRARNAEEGMDAEYGRIFRVYTLIVDNMLLYPVYDATPQITFNLILSVAMRFR